MMVWWSITSLIWWMMICVLASDDPENFVELVCSPLRCLDGVTNRLLPETTEVM